METRKTKFGIQNTHCIYYQGLSQCGKDKKAHTCCQEECTLPEFMLGGIVKEEHMNVYHDFKNGICEHCGEKQVILLCL